MNHVAAAVELVLRNAVQCAPALAETCHELHLAEYRTASGARVQQSLFAAPVTPGSGPLDPPTPRAAAVVLRNALRLAPDLRRASGWPASAKRKARKSQAYGDAIIVRWRREQVAALWSYLESLPVGMRACTRDALHVLEREAAAGSSRNELLAGLGAAPHVVYARVRDKLKRMQRMAAHGKNPLDTGFDRMSTRGHVQRWPEWTKMAMVKLPGGCGGLQQLFEAIAADPAMAQYLDWRADPNCRAVPRWRQQLKKTLSRLPYFVNTGVRARDGTNCHVYRYDQGIEDALAQQHRGGRTQS